MVIIICTSRLAYCASYLLFSFPTFYGFCLLWNYNFCIGERIGMLDCRCIGRIYRNLRDVTDSRSPFSFSVLGHRKHVLENFSLIYSLNAKLNLTQYGSNEMPPFHG